MPQTARGKFWSDNIPGINRAAAVIATELQKRRRDINPSAAKLIAMLACAAFADVPETPAAVALANLDKALKELDEEDARKCPACAKGSPIITRPDGTRMHYIIGADDFVACGEHRPVKTYSIKGGWLK